MIETLGLPPARVPYPGASHPGVPHPSVPHPGTLPPSVPDPGVHHTLTQKKSKSTQRLEVKHQIQVRDKANAVQTSTPREKKAMSSVGET